MDKVTIDQRGYFWWHDEQLAPNVLAPDSAVTGALTISETGSIRLILDGYLSNPHGAASVLENDQEFLSGKNIQGILIKESEKILLLDLLRVGGSFKTHGISHQEYIASHCLIGGNAFKQLDELLKFSEAFIDLENYATWFSSNLNSKKQSSGNIVIEYKKLKNLEYTIDEGKVFITYEGSHSGYNVDQPNIATLTEYVLFSFEPTVALSLNEIKDFFISFQDLMIILTDSDQRVQWPTVKSQNNDFYKYYFPWGSATEKKVTWTKLPVSFTDIRESFGNLVSQWTKKRRMFGPGVYLYLGTRRGMPMYIEHRFVNMIWGLEAFHRKSNVQPLQDTNNAEMIKRILSQVTDKKDAKWLRKKLKRPDEINLERRMFDTLERIDLVVDLKRLRMFCRGCAERRNEISHYGGQKDGSNYKDFLSDLSKKIEALSYLFHALLLSEAGVDRALIKKWFYEGNVSFRIKHALAEADLLESNI